MNYKFLFILGVAFYSNIICHAQKIDTSKSRSEMDKFVNSITDDFNNFRRNAMAHFAEFVKDPWKEFDEIKPVHKPNPKPIPPVIMENNNEKKIENKPIIIEEVVEPIIEEPQPQPVEPIEEVPIIAPSYLNFAFLERLKK